MRYKAFGGKSIPLEAFPCESRTWDVLLADLWNRSEFYRTGLLRAWCLRLRSREGSARGVPEYADWHRWGVALV